MKNTFIVIGLLIVGGLIAVWVTDMQENNASDTEETPEVATESSLPVDPNADVTEDVIEIIPELEYSGALEDVTDDGEATGEIKATVYSDESYDLTATFSDLADPEGTDFYEGWLVRSDPSSVISTGKAEKVDETYQNSFQSEENLSDHTTYVLTLEPDDGDDAPADHVLEGTLTVAE